MVTAVVFAYHDVGVRCLNILLAHGIHIAFVATHEDDPAENIWFESVVQLCNKQSIPFLTPANPKSETLLDRVRAVKPDFIFSFYYRYMLPMNLLGQAKLGAYNMHGSLLPKYRGRAPVNWAVLHGETETGMTLHEMLANPDAGCIISQEKVPILPDETAHQVFNKLSAAAETALRKALPGLLDGTYTMLPNDISKGSYFGRRTPEDGRIDWSKPAQEVYNLHRAVAPPYPGAWTTVGNQKLIIGKARISNINQPNSKRGLITINDAIIGVCGDGLCLDIHELLDDRGEAVEASMLRHTAALPNDEQHAGSKSIFILGIDGFIGHHLLRCLLETTDWKIAGMDMSYRRIEQYVTSFKFKSRIDFRLGNVEDETEWIHDQVRRCDIIVPLAAIATPWHYIKIPLRIFEVDFEANLTIVRLASKYSKRLVFPSTSEVYGMCRDEEFNVDTSELVCGPINKPRWIYSCSKQLLDRLILAYGAEGLDFTIFRPFNWFGPGLDSMDNSTAGSSRVTTQFLGHIIRGEDVVLVDGGHQKRTFLYIDDAMEALMKILKDETGRTHRKIYNIGSPANNVSIKGLADIMLQTALSQPQFAAAALTTRILTGTSSSYYGEGYQDIQQRVPNIQNTCEDLQWTPTLSIEEGLLRLFRDLTAKDDTRPDEAN